MARLFLTNIDMNGNQVLGLRLEVLASDPGGGGLYEGRIWFNSADNFIKYFDGSGIVVIGSGGGGGVQTLTVDDATIENTGDGTDPNIRVKVGGILNTHITGPIDFSKLASPITTFSLNGQKITNLADPTGAQDGATKAYVDAVINGMKVKQPVRAATINNIALATSLDVGDQIDGVTLALSDRVLVKNQVATSENGVYVVTAGAPVRADDANHQDELVGAAVFVSEGTVNADTFWVQTTNAPINVGTTGLTWAQFAGPGTTTAGTGLEQSGGQISLDVPVQVLHGGTGGGNAEQAKANLLFMTRHVENVGNGSATSFLVNHNFGTRDVIVEVYANSGFAKVETDVVHTDDDNVTVAFATAPASNAYRVVVVG